MHITDFLSSHCLHDSLIEKIEYIDNTVNITMDYCFWAQDDYIEGNPETGIVVLSFPNITDYKGLLGIIDEYSILETEYEDGCLSVLIMDDFNNKSYLLKIYSSSGEVSIKKNGCK